MSDRLSVGALMLVGLLATVLVLATHGERPSTPRAVDADTVVNAEVVSGDPTPDRTRATGSDPAASSSLTSPRSSRSAGTDRGSGVPRLERPLPESATSVHDLVAGYPADILPVPPGSRVQGSSVSPAAGSLQVSLQANLPLTARALLRYFRVELGDNGFAQQSVLSADTASAAAFARGRDSVVVTVSTTGPGRTAYTVFGTLRLR